MTRRMFTAGLAIASACNRQRLGTNQIRAIFEGFEYIGTSVSSSHKLAQSKPASRPFPSEFSSGFSYVFHLIADCDFEEIACQTLPKRISSIGAHVNDAPRSGLDMATPNLGNPIWWIQFTFGGQRFEIRNSYNRALDPTFTPHEKNRRHGPDPRIDDYVLIPH